MSGVYVTLSVGSEIYALPVENVIEVAELGLISPVPGTSAAVLGVRNLRGQVLPVYDLAAIFGIERERPPERLVVAEVGGRRAGLAIDEVTDVGLLPDMSEDSDSRFLVGSTLADEGLIGVVDVARVFQALEEEAKA